MMRTTRLGFAAGRKAAGRPIVLAALIALAGVPGSAAAQTAALAAPPPAPQGNGVGSAFELTFWQSVTGSEDMASYEAYLARYPDGTFSGLARARMAALQRAAAAQGPAPTLVTTPTPALTPTLAPAPEPTPAVLTVPQTAQPLAPTPTIAVAVTTAEAAPAPPPAAEMIPANTALASAEAAPSPLARLLAQLRGSGQPAAAPMVTPAPPVQPLPAAAPAPVQPAYAPAPQAAVLAPAATQAVSYTSARPLLLPVPEVVMPAYFCGIDARNQFHNSAYRPAVEIATRNNEAAVAYLRQLQQTYDRGQLGRDTTVLNAIAAEARAFQSEAARAYSVQAGLVRQFDALMAVPLRACALAVQ
jgi:hypothetical protein